MVEMYSSIGLVMALYVARIVSFGFPRVVGVGALSLRIILRVFVGIVDMFVVWGRESVVISLS